MVVEQLIRAAASLRDDVGPIGRRLVSEGSVDVCYNPLDYAWDVHEAYLRRMGSSGARTIVLGINPGPLGMGQSGVAFGATSVVRDLLGITGIPVSQPEAVDPRRPVVGLEYPREEVSGTRLWGALAEMFGSADEIHAHLFVVNHCPLLMYNADGQNITPDKLRGPVAAELLAACDEHLRTIAEVLQIQRIIGVGRYAQRQAAALFSEIEVDWVPHPSPASPFANKNGGADWRDALSAALRI